MNRIYLDHAATTPVHPKVTEAIVHVLNDCYGNPSSIHHDGRKAKVIIEEAREKIAHLLGREPAEVVFTSSATESINTVLKGLFFKNYPNQSVFRSTSVEHHATLHTLQYLENKNCDVVYEPVNTFGELANISNNNVDLNSFMLVNNETGAVLSKDIFEKLLGRKEKIHIDAVQALGKVPFNEFHQADYLSFSGHKIGAPKGVGFLLVKSGSDFEEFFHGGAQERNRRAGTEAVHHIAGLASAIEIILSEQAQHLSHVEQINRFVRNGLLGLGHDIVINSPNHGSPYILNFTFSQDEDEKIDGEAVLMALDGRGISVSNGSACSSGSFEPSHVLKAIGKSDYEAQATLRLSFSSSTTIKEVEIFLDEFDLVLKRMKSINF